MLRCWPGSRRWNRVGTRADKMCVCGRGVRGGCGKVVSKGKDVYLMRDGRHALTDRRREMFAFVRLFIRSHVWAAALLISQVAGLRSQSSKTKKVKSVRDSCRRLTS